VSVGYGVAGDVSRHTDLSRLSPLPSAAHPEVMFMGVLSGGKQAMFALAAGVGHSGPGLCRPSRAHCWAVVLKQADTEILTVPAANGGASRQVHLHVTRIDGRTTRSPQVALAAYESHSGVGLCEVDLAYPAAYNLLDGTVSNVAAAACRHHSSAVPFPFVTAGP
jgi:hypothetical protein